MHPPPSLIPEFLFRNKREGIPNGNLRVRDQLILAIVYSFFLLLPINALADSNNNELNTALKKAKQLELFKQPTWLRLLHFNPDWKKKSASEILTPLFFLSYNQSFAQSTQQISPKAELEATLRGIFQAVGKNPNLHPQCRFPARFFWLQQQLNLDKNKLPRLKCERLEKWSKFSSLDSVSFVLVGGYFGNPASTFGHLLVKLNNSEYKNSSGNLLDQTVNYGAQVPENETIPVYIVKGLLGGYMSRFRDKVFYKQDRVYSRQELRDMWEYELNLSTQQQRFLVYHLWEVMGMESTYYFLKKNCAYRVAELLELVTGKTLKPNYQPWYLPISLFQTLTDLEQSYYIKKITYLPSNQRKLSHQFEQLQADEATLVKQLIKQKNALNQQQLKKFSTERQAKIIEVMLAYYEYKLIDNDQGKSIINSLKKRKNQLLLLRLQLPIIEQKQKIPVLKAIPSPASGSKPRLFSVGLGHQRTGKFIKLGFTAIHYDLLTQSYGMLENAKLKVFDLNLKGNSNQKLSLDSFNLLSIEKLNTNSSEFLQQNDLSWRIKVGIKARNNHCTNCNGLYLSAGIGKAWKVSSQLESYLMLDGSYHGKQDDLLITPNIGLILNHSNKLKSTLELGLITNTKNGQKDKKIEWQTRYSFSKNKALRFSYQKDNNKFSVSYYYHW